MPLNPDKKNELSKQAEFHQGLARILRDPKFSDALDETADNPQSRQQALNDPHGYFKQRGVDIRGMGQGWSVSAHSSPWICIQICLWSWCWNFCW